MGTLFYKSSAPASPAATVAQVTKEHDGAKSKARSQLAPASHMISNTDLGRFILGANEVLQLRLLGSRT
jgi:hypothetical protein